MDKFLFNEYDRLNTFQERNFKDAVWSLRRRRRPFLSGASQLCSGGAGFVSAVIATLAAGARTAPAKTLRGEVPVVDRLAVRMVTDNIVIQFIPTETRNGVTIERKSGNTVPDKPPRAVLNGEWGLAMHAQSFAGDEERNVLVDFGYTPEVLNNNLAILKIDPAIFDALGAEPRPLRSFRRHGRLPQRHQRQTQKQNAVLCRRRRLLLPAPQSRRQFRRARPQGDSRRRPDA